MKATHSIQAISHATVHTGTEAIDNQVVIIENGQIKSIQKHIPLGAKIIDLSGYHVSSGFIETHINGGEKYYFTKSPTEETIHDIYEGCLKTGTTYVLPALITSSHENILQGIEATKNYIAKHKNGVLGMHLEGPFLNVAKRGAHMTKYIRKPTNAEIAEIIKYGKDVIKIMTIAPENFSDEQLEMLLESDITISAGHSNATYQEAQHAFEKGVRLVTHLFNAMSQMGHRELGLVGATFDNDDVYAPIILDGLHCDYAAARIAYKIKKDKLFLISDALFINQKVADFQWQEFDAYLKNGAYRNSEGNLAGASISLADAVRNAVLHVGISLEEAIKMATIRAAKAIGMENKIGQIAAGFPANFVVFKDDFTEFKTLQII